MRIRTAFALGLLVTLAGCAAKTGGDGVATAAGTPAASSTATATAPTDDGDARLKFAQCMREHGMSWFPDPEPGTGGLQIKVPPGLDKAKVDAAMAACKKFMPNGGAPERLDPAQLEQVRRMSQCMRDHGITAFPDPDADGRIQLNGDTLGTGPGQPKFDAAEKACAQYRPKGPSAGSKDGAASNTVIG
jgi:hypothetical protein